MAAHLGIPVNELKSRIGYSEFLEWKIFLDKEEERQTKLDYYLAQIAAEVRRGWVKNPKSVKVKDMLLNVQNASGPAEKRIARSKAVWLGAVNLKGKES